MILGGLRDKNYKFRCIYVPTRLDILPVTQYMKQLLETMCGGDFLSKNPDEAMDFLNYVAETSKAWDEPNPRETDRHRPPVNQRGGKYSLAEDVELKAKLSTLTRRMEELEMRNQQEVRAVTEIPVPLQPCFTCQSTGH